MARTPTRKADSSLIPPFEAEQTVRFTTTLLARNRVIYDQYAIYLKHDVSTREKQRKADDYIVNKAAELFAKERGFIQWLAERAKSAPVQPTQGAAV